MNMSLTCKLAKLQEASHKLHGNNNSFILFLEASRVSVSRTRLISVKKYLRTWLLSPAKLLRKLPARLTLRKDCTSKERNKEMNGEKKGNEDDRKEGRRK
jgi:hypothetical protein